MKCPVEYDYCWILLVKLRNGFALRRTEIRCLHALFLCESLGNGPLRWCKVLPGGVAHDKSVVTTCHYKYIFQK